MDEAVLLRERDVEVGDLSWECRLARGGAGASFFSLGGVALSGVGVAGCCIGSDGRGFDVDGLRRVGGVGWVEPGGGGSGLSRSEGVRRGEGGV